MEPDGLTGAAATPIDCDVLLEGWPIAAFGTESGHAVGRFLTAEAMGIEADAAVAYIEMHDGDPAPKSLGSEGRLYGVAATTFGPFWSAEIEAASRPVNERYGINVGDRHGIDGKDMQRAAPIPIAGSIRPRCNRCRP